MTTSSRAALAALLCLLVPAAVPLPADLPLLPGALGLTRGLRRRG